MDISFFQCHLLKRLSSLYGIVFAPLSKICQFYVYLFLCSLFYFIHFFFFLFSLLFIFFYHTLLITVHIPPLWDNFPFFSPLFQSSIGYCETSGPLSVNIFILWTSFSEYSFYYFDFHTIRLPCEDATFLSVLSKLSWCGFCLFTSSRLRVQSMVRCPLVPHCHFQITYTVSSIGECDWMDRSPALLSFYYLTRTSLLSWSFSSTHH